MSGGGSFRGRGFGSHGHHHQGSNRPPAPNSRSNGPNGRSAGPSNRSEGQDTRFGSPRNESPNSRSHNVPNSRPDGSNLRTGNANFRAAGPGSHGPRPNFNLPRHQPRHPSRPAENNWVPRGGPQQNFSPWRGGRARFTGPPRPFFRGRGQSNHAQYRFPFMGGPMPPFTFDFQPIPEPKPATPHLGSEEERLQKITEAANDLKRKLSAVPNEPDAWYNGNDDDAVDFRTDADYESRIVNRGIPELKHDPPELNLTLNDLRDIGRVDHDHTSKQAKPSAEDASNSPFEEEEDGEVTILDYTPTEAMIEIDLWSDDNFCEFEDCDSDSVPKEQSGEMTDISEKSHPNDERDGAASTLDSIVEENTSLPASANEDSQERKKNEKSSEISTTGAEIDHRENHERQPRSQTSIEKFQDTNVENVQSPLVESRTKIHEIDSGKSSEQTTNSGWRERQEDAASPVGEISKETRQDKKVEDVRIESDYVNIDKSITDSCENTVVIEKNKKFEKINDVRDNSGTKIYREKHETLQNGNVSTKNSADVEVVEIENRAKNDQRVDSESAIVAEKTNDASTKQSSSESHEATRKSDSPRGIESDVPKEDTTLKVASENLFKESRIRKEIPPSSDNEKSDAHQDAITGIAATGERQHSEEKTVEARNERKEREWKDDEISRRIDRAMGSDRSNGLETSKNKNSSNAKTEERERTEPSSKLNFTKDSQIDKNIVEKRKFDRSSQRDQKIEKPQSPTSGDDIRWRRKLVRKMPDITLAPRNRESTSSDSSTRPSQRDFEPRESRSSSYYGQNVQITEFTCQESGVSHQIPLAFDPRLSLQEREALINSSPLAASSIIISHDFGMTQVYPPCPIANFGQNVPPMNYGAPGPPIIAAPRPPMPSATAEATIHHPDAYGQIMSLPRMPASIPLPTKMPMHLAPPLPAEPPPPPPPPAKSNLDMVDELEDMQEAMEFAKRFMNMGGGGNIGNVDYSADPNFFHMPTFPDLPPIELPPLPPPGFPRASAISRPSEIPVPAPIPSPSGIPMPATIPSLSDIPTPRTPSENLISPYRQGELSKDRNKSMKLIKCEPMNTESQSLHSDRDVAAGTTRESPPLNDECMRTKVVFDLNPKVPKLSVPGAWQHQPRREVAEPPKSMQKLSDILTASLIEMKEKARLANGHEDREIFPTRSDGRPSRFSSIVNCAPSRKPEESSISKSAESPKSIPTDSEKIEQSSRRATKDSSVKKSTETGTPEASWKNRVIGRFLKMSKNDICNMLNSSSLRKFDIAMNHLVKERRSSQSLGIRSNEEETAKHSEVSYDREEFMDQLSAMLDPSATVDVCNLPTQFIHHLSEVLQLDTLSDFESAPAPAKSNETSSPTLAQPSPTLRRVPRAASAYVQEIDDHSRPPKKGRETKATSTCGGVAVDGVVATTSATVPASTAVTGKSSARTCDDHAETRCVNEAERTIEETKTNRATTGPRGRRRSGRPAIVEEATASMTVNNGVASQNDTNIASMANLDDVFSPSIARDKKTVPSVATPRNNEVRTSDFNNPANNTASNDRVDDPSADRVERAAVELDKIFTAGIARFKLPSIKATAAVTRAAEAYDEEPQEEEDHWNRGERRSNSDTGRKMQRPVCRFNTKGDKWCRNIASEDRDAFRNLTKEEWEARNSESSYASYEEEYRGLVAIKARRSEYETVPEIAPPITGIKSRLGSIVPADGGMREAWSDSDDGARYRNASDPMNFDLHAYNRSSGESSSSSSMSTSSSDSSDEKDEESPSVTRLLKVIKAKEKIAKKKSLNEEIRDEVAAEIEKSRRERSKLHKSHHKSKSKKSHRRRRDRKEKGKERKKKERKRKRRKSRRSGSDSRESSDYDDIDEGTSSAPRGQKSSRLLTENEIKREIIVKDEPELEGLLPGHVNIRSKSALAMRFTDETRPALTSSPSSLPAVALTSSLQLSASASSQQKTKAQLKEMPAAKKVIATTGGLKEIAKSQQLPFGEAKKSSTIVVAANPVIPEAIPIINETTQSPVPSTSSRPVASSQVQATPSTNDEASTCVKSKLKKLDLKAYQERTRQRQIREVEQLRQISENPSLLTQNILDISTVRKTVTGTTDKTVVGATDEPKNSRLASVEESKVTAITATMTNSTVVSSSSRTSTSSTAPSISPMTAVTSPCKVISGSSSSAKIVSTTTSTPTISSTPAATKIAPESSQLAPSKNVPPTKLIRRKNVTTAPPLAAIPSMTEVREEAGKFAFIKSEGGKEMKLREKLKRGHRRASAEGLETTIPTTKPARVRRRNSLPSDITSEERAPISFKKIIPGPAIVTVKKQQEESAVVISKILAAEPAFNAVKPKEESAVILSEKPARLPAVTSKEPEAESSIIISEKSVNNSATAPEKSTEEFTGIPMGGSTSGKAVIHPEKSTEQSGITPSEESTTEHVGTHPEESQQKSDSDGKIDVVEFKWNRCESGLNSDGFPDTVPQEYLPSVAPKISEILPFQSEDDPLAMPITDLPDWPMEPSVSPNLSENGSNEDPPFRGFTKEAIILQDRALTEAEGSASETDDLGTVSLAFANDPDASEGGGLALDEVTSTGVSLEAPHSYGDEEFVEEGVETSLLGFPEENEITEAPDSLPLDSENDLISVEIDKSTVKPLPEEPPSKPAVLLSRTTPTLNESPLPDDFVITNVERQESIPSPLLVTESIPDDSKTTPDLSPKDNAGEVLTMENAEGSRSDAAEVGTAREIENKESERIGSPVVMQHGEKMGSLQSRTTTGEKLIHFQMERIKSVETEKSINISDCREKQVEKEAAMDRKDSTAVPASVPCSQQTTSSDIVEETNKEATTTEKLQPADEVDVKTKDSQRRSRTTAKEHSHGRNKKKSSRHHNHGPAANKKNPITEKMVEEAISSNIVRVVPKPSSKETVLARMVEIDVEIHKLMNEKMTLYTMLQSGEFPAKDDSVVGATGGINDEVNKTSASEREEAMKPDIAAPTVLAACLVRNLDKTVPAIATKTQESRKVSSEHDAKTKKRKRSPQRETKHRSKNSPVLETRHDRNDSESRNQSRKATSDESSRHESISSLSRDKSCSSTELDDSEESRSKSKTKPSDSLNRQTARRTHELSSREDLGDSSERSSKSSKHENSPKRDREKKKSKNLPDAKKSENESKKERKVEERDSKTTGKTGAVIYSDDSTWDSLDPDGIQSDEQRGKKDGTTGLALLEESFKREIAHNRALKNTDKRQNKKQDLRRSILSATDNRPDDDSLGDSSDHVNTPKKLKSDTPKEVPGKVWKHMSSIIDAVAADRLEQLYARETSPESNDSTTVTATSNQSLDTGLRREPSSSIAAMESTRSGTPDTTKKSKLQETVTTLRREADTGDVTGSKESKKPEEIKEAHSSKLKESAINDTSLSVKRSLPVENRKKVRDISYSSSKNTNSRFDIDIFATNNEGNERRSASSDKFEKKKNESSSMKEKRAESRAAEVSRSSSPESSSKAESRSKSVETKIPARGKSMSEFSRLKERSPSDDSSTKSTEYTETVHRPKKIVEDRDRTHGRSDNSSKRRSITPRHMEREKDRKDKYSSRGDNYRDEKSSGRPKSATKRRQREKSIPSNRRNSRYSEDSVKSSRSRKRNRDSSESRGASPHGSESSRKKSHHSHKSPSPKIQATEIDDQSRRRKRKRRPELTREEMMNCKVQLFDCKYSYLSPTMHPRVLKKFGISRINPYVAPIRVSEASRPPQLTREETPSPPILRKVETPKPTIGEALPILRKVESAKQTIVEASPILRRVETPEQPSEESSPILCKVETPAQPIEESSPISRRVETPKPPFEESSPIVRRVETPKPPFEESSPISRRVETPKQLIEESSSIVRKVDSPEVPNEGTSKTRITEEKIQRRTAENNDSEAEDEDTIDETIRIVEAVDNVDDPIVSYRLVEADAPEIIDEISSSADTASQDVIAVEDETTGEMDTENSNPDEIEVLEEKSASTSNEKTAELKRKTPSIEIEEEITYESRRTRYTVHKGPILDIKVLDDSFLAASEDGAIYRYSQTSNGILNIYKGHEAAVTCIHILEMPAKCWNLYSGSLDGTFRCYNITTGAQERPPADVGSPVQCMDQAWGVFFVGTKSGHISRYNIKSGSIKSDRLEFSDNSVLALKASSEGPRRVLIVASRNQPITIRDALTGLFLRTICGYKNHTVYSLMRERNYVYCGTSSTSIPVFDFTNGEQVTQYNAGVGIVCMRLYRQILFAGCYDGNIYVFDTKEPKLIVSIPGPGNMLLSMEVVGDEIIAGSKDRQLHSWRMPKQVRALLSERTT